MSTIGATLVMFADEGLWEFQDFRTPGLGLTLAPSCSCFPMA